MVHRVSPRVFLMGGPFFPLYPPIWGVQIFGDGGSNGGSNPVLSKTSSRRRRADFFLDPPSEILDPPYGGSTHSHGGSNPVQFKTSSHQFFLPPPPHQKLWTPIFGVHSFPFGIKIHSHGEFKNANFNSISTYIFGRSLGFF